jgi:hypothetical protein
LRDPVERNLFKKDVRLPEPIGTTRKWHFMLGQIPMRLCLKDSVLEDKYHECPMRDSLKQCHHQKHSKPGTVDA